MVKCDRDCNVDRERKMVEASPDAWCDPCIAAVIYALNAGGVKTIASCCGHGRRPGFIALVDGRVLVLARSLDEAKAITMGFPDINSTPC